MNLELTNETYIFRAWDIQSKTMSKPFTLFDLTAGTWWKGEEDKDIVCLPDGTGIDKHKIFSDLIFMLFIGEVDKNKIPIFVGDIIRMGKRLFVLNFIEELYFDESHFLNDGLQDPEVIGNIYENPELLSD